ncbi:MAG: prepilin-type N-terminal cleavage/methylation domain-containing protein [Candidatus Chromulinivorax sp.]
MHSHTKQQGFSLIELAIVLALLGLLGAFMVPNLFKTQLGAERKEFLASFQALIKDAVLRSIVENKVHQIYLDIAHETIQLRMYDEKSIEHNKHKQFKLVQDQYYKTQIPFLKHFSIKNFFINGVEEIRPGTKMEDVFFYIMPDGTSQAITINIMDEYEDGISADVPMSIVISPFYARMQTYETFQQP